MNADLWTELEGLTKELDESIGELRTTGSKLAQAERDYRVELRKVSMALKMNGLAVGMIQLVAKGEPKVANLRMERDVAETMYQASREVVMATKLKIRVVSHQLGVEFGNPQARY